MLVIKNEVLEKCLGGKFGWKVLVEFGVFWEWSDESFLRVGC